MNKILFVGTDRKYYHVKENKEKNSLNSVKTYVLATDVVPYGFDFTFGKHFGEHNETFWTPAYIQQENIGLSKEEVAQKNLKTTIRELEKLVKDAKADFILVDDFTSRDSGTGWDISGRGQLLIKR